MDSPNPRASALAIHGGTADGYRGSRLLAVGRDDQILADFGEGSEIIDLGGRTILPGLIDSHVHLKQYAENFQKINCQSATRKECIQRVAQQAKITPPGEWILGHGWSQNDWPEGFGSATELDVVAPDHPVFPHITTALRGGRLRSTRPGPGLFRPLREAERCRRCWCASPESWHATGGRNSRVLNGSLAGGPSIADHAATATR